MNKISFFFVLIFSTTMAYSQCESYLQKADILFSQEKYEDAKKQYLAYKECKRNAKGIDEKIAECDKLNRKAFEGKGADETPLPIPIPMNWYNEGVKNSNASNYSEAIRCYRKALDADPSLLDAWSGLTDAYFHLNKYAEAIDCFKKVPTIHRSAVMWNEIGICYKNLQDYDNAIYCFQKSNDINNNGGVAWFNMGLCYANKRELSTSQKLSKSKECFRKAAELGHEKAKEFLR